MGRLSGNRAELTDQLANVRLLVQLHRAVLEDEFNRKEISDLRRNGRRGVATRVLRERGEPR